MSAGNIAAIGAGVAAVGAGAYYFLGQKGKQRQRKAKVWMIEMEMEIGKKLKKVKSVTDPLYHSAVDALAQTYSKQYKEYACEINAFATKLKDEWKNTRRKARHVIKKTKPAAKKSS